MPIKTTVIGFYDSMGYDAVNFCLEQTKLTTIFCSGDYLAKIIEMKSQQKAQHVENVVLFDKDEATYEQNLQKTKEAGLKVLMFDDVIEAG